MAAAWTARSTGRRAENNLKSVAFPCISTGVYGYPIEDAAQIAIRETKAFLATHPDMKVTFCCFSKRDKEVYDKLLGYVAK